MAGYFNCTQCGGSVKVGAKICPHCNNDPVSWSDKLKGKISAFFMITGLIIAGIVYLFMSAKEGLGYFDGYITLKLQVGGYEKIIEEPKDKQNFLIKNNNVLKVIKLHKKEYYSWIESWYLKNNVPEKIFILIPEKIETLKNVNKYFSFNTESKTWNNYYTMIDNKNTNLYNKYKTEFIEQTKDIQILNTKDSLEKEKIVNDDTFVVLNSDGFFGYYKTSDSITYYSQKENYKKIKAIYNEKFNNYKKKQG